MWRKITVRIAMLIVCVVLVLALIPLGILEYHQTGMPPYETLATGIPLVMVDLVVAFIKFRNRPNENRIIEDFKMYSADFGDSRGEIRAKNLFYTGFEEWYCGEITAACYDMERAISTTTNRRAQAKIYCCLGQCQYRKKRWRQKAMESLRQAIRLDPQFDLARNEMARQLLESGDRAAAKDACDRGIQINPRSEALLTKRVNILVMEKDYRRALPDCLRAEKLDPQDPILLMNSAIVYAGLGERHLALEKHRQAVDAGYRRGEDAFQMIRSLLLEHSVSEHAESSDKQ